MNKKIKIIISILIILFVIFSSIEYINIPNYKENVTSVHKNSNEGAFIEYFNSTYSNYKSYFMLIIGRDYSTWHNADEMHFCIGVIKTNQTQSFPFTNSLFIIKNIIINNSNNSTIAYTHYSSTYENNNTVNFVFRMCPYYTYKPPFNISLTIKGEYVLYSLIYHVKIDKTLNYNVEIL